jgi:hypothetical protein
MTEIIKKPFLSTADLTGESTSKGAAKMRAILAANGNNETILYTIIGEVDSVNEGVSEKKKDENGQGVKFNYILGRFMAKSKIDSKIYESKKLFLTKAFTKQLKETVQANPGVTIKFHANVSIAYDEKAPVGYRFIIEEPLTEKSKSWRLEALEKLDSPLLLGNG